MRNSKKRRMLNVTSVRLLTIIHLLKVSSLRLAFLVIEDSRVSVSVPGEHSNSVDPMTCHWASVEVRGHGVARAGLSRLPFSGRGPRAVFCPSITAPGQQRGGGGAV